MTLAEFKAAQRIMNLRDDEMLRLREARLKGARVGGESAHGVGSKYIHTLPPPISQENFRLSPVSSLAPSTTLPLKHRF